MTDDVRRVWLWHFHEDLLLGERYKVCLERVTSLEYRVVVVSRPPRPPFDGKVLDLRLELHDGGDLRRPVHARNSTGYRELDGLNLSDVVPAHPKAP